MAVYRIVYKNEVSHGLLSSFKSKSKYIGGFIKGKNTSAYNHDYYLKNKFRWRKKGSNALSKGLNFLNGLFSNDGGTPADIVEPKFEDFDDDISKRREVATVKNDNHKYKYIYKVQNSAGKWRYFYSEAEYVSFMNNVKRKDPDKEWSMEDDAGEVNPNYHNYDTRTTDYTHNCPYTSLAYDLRRRGYDVQAIGDSDGETSDTIESWYKNGKFVDLLEPTEEDKEYIRKCNDFYNTDAGDKLLTDSITTKLKISKEELFTPEYDGIRLKHQDDPELTRSEKQEYADQMVNDLKSQGNGARGFVTVKWRSGGSHAVQYEVQNDKVYICDGQTGEVTPAEKFLGQDGYGNSILWRSNTVIVLHVDKKGNHQLEEVFDPTVSYMRTDNLELSERVRELFISNGVNDQDSTANIPRDAHVVKVTDPKEIEEFYEKYDDNKEPVRYTTRKKESK